MSKMTPAEAIFLLQHLDRLDDVQVQEVCELIARQQRMIEMACEQFAAIGIGCPASVDKVDWPECDISCEVSKNEAECWLKWLEQEGEK